MLTKPFSQLYSRTQSTGCQITGNEMSYICQVFREEEVSSFTEMQVESICFHFSLFYLLKSSIPSRHVNFVDTDEFFTPIRRKRNNHTSFVSVYYDNLTDLSKRKTVFFQAAAA